MESIKRRTHTCGELRAEHSGETVTLHGWAESVRDKGGVMFLILRDRYGTVQITLNDSCGDEAWTDAKATRLEYVLEVDGVVHARSEQAVNQNMDTGAIEVKSATTRVPVKKFDCSIGI
jgi:aspartyl-tRNA synthetase